MKIQLLNDTTIEDKNGVIIVGKILSNLGSFILYDEGIMRPSDTYSTVGKGFHILTHRIRLFEKGYSNLRTTCYTGHE